MVHFSIPYHPSIIAAAMCAMPAILAKLYLLSTFQLPLSIKNHTFQQINYTAVHALHISDYPSVDSLIIK